MLLFQETVKEKEVNVGMLQEAVKEKEVNVAIQGDCKGEGG